MASVSRSGTILVFSAPKAFVRDLRDGGRLEISVTERDENPLEGEFGIRGTQHALGLLSCYKDPDVLGVWETGTYSDTNDPYISVVDHEVKLSIDCREGRLRASLKLIGEKTWSKQHPGVTYTINGGSSVTDTTSVSGSGDSMFFSAPSAFTKDLSGGDTLDIRVTDGNSNLLEKEFDTHGMKQALGTLPCYEELSIKGTIEVSKAVWECFADRPNRRVTFLGGSLAGCGGWDLNVIEKWDSDTLTVYIEPEGDKRYQEIAMETLEYLSTILRMTFVYDTEKNNADLLIYAGVPSSWYARIGQKSYCESEAGCGGPDTVRSNTILQASFSVWYDSKDSNNEIRHTTIHEALHALTGVRHSTNPESMMSHSALRLPYLVTWEREMYELYSNPLIKPGMTLDDIQKAIVFTDAASSDDEASALAIAAHTRLLGSSEIEFQVQVHYLSGNCDKYNYYGTVKLGIIGENRYKNMDLLRFSREDVSGVRFNIQRLLVYIARSRNAQLEKVGSGVKLLGSLSDFGLAKSDWHTGYTIDYVVVLDDDDRVESFEMGWTYRVTGNSCSHIRVEGNQFLYR